MQWYKGYGNRTMGKWAILINHERLYWFYGDGGSAGGYGERHYMRLNYLGYISTWSRDYHVYYDRWDQALPYHTMQNGNSWVFSEDDIKAYGDIIEEFWRRLFCTESLLPSRRASAATSALNNRM